MLTNLETAVAVIASHREARGWTDEAVALDLLAQLGLEADGVPQRAISEDEVAAVEAAAEAAAVKAVAARGVLAEQQREAQAFADATAADLAKATEEARAAAAAEKARAARDAEPHISRDGAPSGTTGRGHHAGRAARSSGDAGTQAAAGRHA